MTPERLSAFYCRSGRSGCHSVVPMSFHNVLSEHKRQRNDRRPPGKSGVGYLHIYPYLPPYVTHMYPIYTPYVPIYTPGGRAGGRTNKLLRDTHTHFRNLWVLDIPIYGTIWDLFGIFGTIWDNLGPYGLFGDHSGPFLNYLGPFGTIWASNLYV